MNDFTKEELEIIKSWCVSKIDMVGLINFVGTNERQLQSKIQSMIDNYCEHQPDIERPYICAECGKELEI